MARKQIGGNSIFGEFIKQATPLEVESEEDKQRKRIEACSTDMALFAKTYFPEIFKSNFCEFHTEIIGSIQNTILHQKNKKNYYCRSAPRGHGKSQVISFLLILWCICYAYKKNIVLISDTNDQAKGFIMALKQELEDNELLREDFGDLVGRAVWSQDKIVTANDIQVFGRGAGQKLRGVKYRNTRPDLVIIDDLENDESVETEVQRKKLRNWFLKALMPVGNPTTDYVYIGTVLHYESLLQELLTSKKFSNWNRKKYQAVYKFSSSAKWDAWEAIMSDISREDPAEDGYNFYMVHRLEMIGDIEVLWGDSDPDYYYNLMIMRWQDEDAFASEYQNDPISERMRVFQEDWIQYWEELPEIIEVHGAIDPSLGKDKSDRAGMVWLGKSRDNYLYVLEVTMGRFKPDQLIEIMIAGAIKYQDKLKTLTVETVQFQAMFADELRKRAMNIGLPLPIEEFNDKTEKGLRLKGLAPKVKNGYIKFHRSQIPLLSELRRFPKSSDDGLDALQMAVSNAYPAVSGLVFGKVEYHGGSYLRY